jgi:hypothetical protein
MPWRESGCWAWLPRQCFGLWCWCWQSPVEQSTGGAGRPPQHQSPPAPPAGITAAPSGRRRQGQHRPLDSRHAECHARRQHAACRRVGEQRCAHAHAVRRRIEARTQPEARGPAGRVRSACGPSRDTRVQCGVAVLISGAVWRAGGASRADAVRRAGALPRAGAVRRAIAVRRARACGAACARLRCGVRVRCGVRGRCGVRAHCGGGVALRCAGVSLRAGPVLSAGAERCAGAVRRAVRDQHGHLGERSSDSGQSESGPGLALTTGPPGGPGRSHGGSGGLRGAGIIMIAE